MFHWKFDRLYYFIPPPRDLEKTEMPTYSTAAHTEIINSIDGVGGLGIGEGPRELVTGSRDGK